MTSRQAHQAAEVLRWNAPKYSHEVRRACYAVIEQLEGYAEVLHFDDIEDLSDRSNRGDRLRGETEEMPAHHETPEPLKGALEEMEAAVQSAKTSLAFAAPEMFDTHWANLQMRLAEIIDTAIDDARAIDQRERNATGSEER